MSAARFFAYAFFTSVFFRRAECEPHTNRPPIHRDPFEIHLVRGASRRIEHDRPPLRGAKIVTNGIEHLYGIALVGHFICDDQCPLPTEGNSAGIFTAQHSAQMNDTFRFDLRHERLSSVVDAWPSLQERVQPPAPARAFMNGPRRSYSGRPARAIGSPLLYPTVASAHLPFGGYGIFYGLTGLYRAERRGVRLPYLVSQNAGGLASRIVPAIAATTAAVTCRVVAFPPSI